MLLLLVKVKKAHKNRILPCFILTKYSHSTVTIGSRSTLVLTTFAQNHILHNTPQFTKFRCFFTIHKTPLDKLFAYQGAPDSFYVLILLFLTSSLGSAFSTLRKRLAAPIGLLVPASHASTVLTDTPFTSPDHIIAVNQPVIEKSPSYLPIIIFIIPS